MLKKILSSSVLSAFLLLFAFTSLNAQQANYELARHFTRQKVGMMTGTNGVSPRWVEGQNKFWYSYKTTEGRFWYLVNAESQTKKELFDRETLAAKLSTILHTAINYQDLPLRGLQYKADEEMLTFQVDGTQFQYELGSSTLTKQDSTTSERRSFWKTTSPDGKWIAFAKDYNLYLMKASNPDKVYQLTTDGERYYSYTGFGGGGEANGRRVRSGARWFNDSNKLYIVRRDSRKVEELWLVHNLDKRPTLETYKYALPGDKYITQTEVWVFNADTLASTAGVLLKTETPKWQDENIRGVKIGDNSDYMWLMRRNRLYDKVDVLKANTSTGDVQVLWSEESQPYLNPRFVDLTILNNGEQFLWWSDRTGWGQFYRYDGEGNLINQVTQGFYTAGNTVKIDEDAQTIYFTGYGREEGVNPYYSMLYKVNFNGSGMQRLTPENATHQISMGDEADYFVDNYSRVDLPTKSVVRNADGDVIVNLEQTDVGQLKKAGWVPPTTFSIKAADGVTDLYGVMWKPFDFDSTKTYPIIVWCYPGPQTVPFPIPFTLSGAGADHVSNMALAQLGFIVVSFGNRGGDPIQPKFMHTYGYGNLRDYALADNKYGIEQLASRYDFIDISKVGIYGHSGGGFMSTAAILTYPDFYDVAVSASGNHDNNVYNRNWSESHNGVKKVTKVIDADPDKPGKQDSTVVTFEAPVESNADLAANLKGHLFLVTGGVDNNVHPAGTIRVADALMKAGKQFDLMIMPGQRHHFGPYKPYYTRMVWRYFAKYLLGDYPESVDYVLPEYDNR